MAATCPHGALPQKQHAATSVTLANNTVRSYCYDHNGNLTRRIKDGNTDNFTYDHKNRLTQVTRGGSALAQYAYDGDGRRVKSVAGGITTYYVNDLVEYSSGVLTTSYVSGDGQRVAQRVGSAAPTYLLVDHLGSTRYVLNNSAQTLSAQRYFPWGSTHFATDANALPRRQYTGQMNEGDTGLYYYNARYYEPGLARFIQADTIVPEPGNPQTLNRYSYVLNNPLKYNDPSGHKPVCEDTLNDSCYENYALKPESIIKYNLKYTEKKYYVGTTGAISTSTTTHVTGGMGVPINSSEIYTHNHHYGAADTVLLPNTINAVTGTASKSPMSTNGGITYDDGNAVIRVPRQMGLGVPAEFASAETVENLQPGAWRGAAYWDDTGASVATDYFQVLSVEGNQAILIDQKMVINPGDSGGPVFTSSGHIVGNTWSFNVSYWSGMCGRTITVALIPPQLQ